MPELDDTDRFAIRRQASIADDDARARDWAIGGSDGPTEHVEYAIEASPGADARLHSYDLAEAIEDLPHFKRCAGIITRTVTYGEWRYVTPDEIRHA